MPLLIKRVYDPPARSDGYRVLVDRIWPRGLGKDKAHVDLWLKEVAPSTELRKWFAHEPGKWEAFLQRYRDELARQPAALARLAALAGAGRVTLLFGAREPRHNHAVALKAFLLEGRAAGADAQ